MGYEIEGQVIRRYLLGQLAEDERQQLEEKMMVDNELFNRVLLAEGEMVEEYVQGELSESERESFEASFLSTPDGCRQVSFARALSRYVSRPSDSERRAAMEPTEERPGRSNIVRPAWWTRPALVAYFRLAAAAVIVLGLALGIWRVFFYQSEVNKGIAALAEAYREQRPLEARITGLNYAPVANTRGDQEKVDRVSRDRAERILFDVAVEDPGPASNHALGRLYLAEKTFDKAIAQFEDALKSDPKNAQLHSDYGAALLEKGKADLANEAGKSLEEFARSLEHLTRALELNANLLEALFNRALCHECMMLPRLAEEDWRTYLERDQNSKWADEARRKLIQVQEQGNSVAKDREQLYQEFLSDYVNGNDAGAWKLISQTHDLTGGFIETKLVDDYLTSAASGEPGGAVADLRALSYVSELEVREAGDHFLEDLIQVYKPATPVRISSIAQARRLTKLGHERLDRSDLEEAIRTYSCARDTFFLAGDACEATYVTYPLGHCYLLQAKTEQGLATFQELARICEKNQYRWLYAQCLNAMANAQITLRDYSVAINNSELSLEVSEQINDTNGVMKTLLQLAHGYLNLNDYQKSLSFNQRSLVLSAIHSPEPIQIWRNYFTTAQSLDRAGLYAAAIDYQKEALRVAIEMQMHGLISRSYSELALLWSNERDYSEAIKDIQLAFEVGESFADETARTESRAYSHLQLGDLYRQVGDFQKALENYDEAIQLYEGLNSKAFNYVAHKGKLLCCIKQGDCSSVEQELETTLNLFEEHRGKILEESNRNAFFDGEQSVYDVAIDFEYSRKGNRKRAFDYSEKCRARSLRDLASDNAELVDAPQGPDMVFKTLSQPLGHDEIQAHLPEQSQIVQYAVLNDRILIWIVSKSEIASAVQEISIDDLNQRVRNYLRLITQASDSGGEEASREAQYLYKLLIEPVESSLDTTKQLCIVPDKILNYLPFGALISPASGKYFVEERSFVLSPSSNLFVMCSNIAREKGQPLVETVLSVGNPSFDRIAFSSLPDLPSAAREASNVARYYNNARLLIGPSATEKRVRKEMERADVIHLALHSVINEASPMRSRLLLAKEPAGNVSGADADGVLQSFEIYKLDMSRAKLVVLSACRTGVEKYFGGEGMIGISRPFIAKKIPTVVASLWPVDSDSTTDLMGNLHKYRRIEKRSPAEALREAQREMINGSETVYRSPFYWASFVAIGGDAEF